MKSRVKMALIEPVMRIEATLAYEALQACRSDPTLRFDEEICGPFGVFDSAMERLLELLYIALKDHRGGIDYKAMSLIDGISTEFRKNNFEEDLFSVDMIGETIALLVHLQRQLTRLGYYDEVGNLLFNSIWFDRPNTLVFFKMEDSDV
jgi:hypothetical protein